MGKYDAKFVPADGEKPITCERDDRPHIEHRDSKGHRVIKAPGGALFEKRPLRYRD
jgi:hypothetical protein